MIIINKMDKKLISEITRIGEMMGVKGSSLILESTLCPFCDVIMKRISDLSALATKNSDQIEFKYKVNELLERVSKSNDLNSNQKAALQNVIKKLKEVESASDNVASFKSKVSAAIEENNYQLKSVVKNTSDSVDNNIMRQIDYSKIYQDPKLVNDFFKNSPKIKETVVEIDAYIIGPDFKTTLSKFKSVDDYVGKLEEILKERFIKDGLDATLSDGLAKRFKNYVKEKVELNPNLNPFVNKIDDELATKNLEIKDFKPPKLEDVKFKPALIEVYNSKTKMYDTYRVNLPDRIVPGRTKEDVIPKMKNLRKDLGIDYLTHNWRKRFGGTPISLTKDGGIVYDGKTGRLYDSNTRYWLNIEYGNIPKADELNYSYSNNIAKDNGKLIGSNKQRQLDKRIEYLNLPKTSSWDEGFDEINMNNYKNLITPN
jgi:hypothetical protein